MTAPTAPVPGWYPDPSSAVPTVRWWDGTQWTDHTAPLQTGPPAPPATPDGVPLADWGRRFGAWIIDYLITSVIAGILLIPAYIAMFDLMEDWFQEIDAAAVTGEQPDIWQFYVDLLPLYAVSIGVTLAVNVVYQAVFLLWRSASPGKLILGLRVRAFDAPGRLSIGMVAKRVGMQYVVFQLLSIVYVNLLDGLWPLWDKKRQSLHDKVARTAVVDVRRS